MIRPFSQISSRLSHRWWWRSFSSFVWIAVITILIWVWADLRFVDSAEFKATIVIDSSANPDLIVASDRNIEVAFKLEGNRAALDKFQRDLLEKSSIIKYDISTFSSSNSPQSTSDMITRAQDLSKLGITVMSASPSSVTIQIDKKVTISGIPVEPGEFVNGVLATGKPPKISPAKVNVVIANREYEKIRKTQSMDKLTLKTMAIDLKSLPTGQEIDREVEIIPELSGSPVELSVPKVTVRLEVATRTAQKEYNVAVRALCPLAWLDDGTWEQYKIVRQDQLDWKKHIIVTGPQQDLDRLNVEDIDAYIVLTDKDKEPVESWLTRDVQFRFPSDMKVGVAGELPKVSFKLVRNVPD